MFISQEEQQDLEITLKDELDLEWTKLHEDEKCAWERIYAKLRTTVLRNH